jgi:hypothetical protein
MDTPARFEATAARTKRVVWAIFGGMAAFYAALAGLGAILPDAAMRFVTPVLVLGSLAGFVLLVARMARQPKVTLDVGLESITVDGGRGGVLDYAGARLGVLRIAGLGVTAGTALHLAGAKRPFLIGGQDHRRSAALRLEAAPIEEVDVTLPAADFDALLAALPDAVFRSRWDAPANAAPIRIALLPNPSAPRYGLRAMLPWLGTIGACIAVAVLFEATGLGETRWGQTVEGPLIYALVGAGIVLTFVVALRRRPGFEIELTDREILLCDPKGRVIAATPPERLGVTRGTYSGRTSFQQIVLTLRFSPDQEVAMGLFDTRFRWGDGVPVKRAPRWIVGVPDWKVLVERLGQDEALIFVAG